MLERALVGMAMFTFHQGVSIAKVPAFWKQPGRGVGHIRPASPKTLVQALRTMRRSRRRPRRGALLLAWPRRLRAL